MSVMRDEQHNQTIYIIWIYKNKWKRLFGYHNTCTTKMYQYESHDIARKAWKEDSYHYIKVIYSESLCCYAQRFWCKLKQLHGYLLYHFQNVPCMACFVLGNSFSWCIGKKNMFVWLQYTGNLDNNHWKTIIFHTHKFDTIGAWKNLMTSDILMIININLVVHVPKLKLSSSHWSNKSRKMMQIASNDKWKNSFYWF